MKPAVHRTLTGQATGAQRMEQGEPMVNQTFEAMRQLGQLARRRLLVEHPLPHHRWSNRRTRGPASKNKTTKYEHVIPQLVAIEQSPMIEGVLIILNTVGGDIEAGLAIAEMIRTMSKPSVIGLGGGHSIGIPIAVAARYSFISDASTVTVHPIRLTGMVIGVPKTYEYLTRCRIGLFASSSATPTSPIEAAGIDVSDR